MYKAETENQRNRRRRECGAKIPHRTSAAARAVVALMRDPERYAAYCCRWCGFWHLGRNGGIQG